MDTVKVVLVVGTFSLLSCVHPASAIAQSLLCQRPEPITQKGLGENERPKESLRDQSRASSVEKDEFQTANHNSNEPDTLRAFESAGRMEGVNVRLLVTLLIFGPVGAIIILFLLYAWFFEPSESSKPYRPTEVKRGENFVPYQHSRSRNELDQ